MRHMRSGTSFVALSIIAALFVGVMFVAPPRASAQATVSTGSIQGAILDPKGAVVVSAKVTIAKKDTAQKLDIDVTGAGTYSSGPLMPGTYIVRVGAQGFKTIEHTVTVEVGVVATANIMLELGSETTVITVESSVVAVNTEQATVQGVLTTHQIENLPLNGRNFLDLAQLEPGVQIQDGANFDPTKNGFSSISFGGRYGRATRIEVDGIDISDETVGTTTQNVPQIAIREFQIGQSSLDLSTELTSSGTVNIVTHSGTNSLHGEGFLYWRGDSVSAKLGPLAPPFDRKQYGARLGGPLLKDKLFFFGGFERTQQSLLAPVNLFAPFTSKSGTFDSPFHDTMYDARLDWQIKPNTLLFYRFSYEQNRTQKGYIPNTFQPFANADNTPVHAVGLDFNTGAFSHSIRFGYTKFRNGIDDAVLGSGIYDPSPGIAIEIGGDPICLTAGVDTFCSGPNFLAPQKTFQSNKQIKYDGSRTLGSHLLRYGVGFNRIDGSVFAAFVGSAPIVGSCGAQCVGADPSNPLQYTVSSLYVGNGQGFFTEKPGFNFPGGASHDNRFQAYFGDTWKMRPNFSLSLGLRYVHDTGRSQSDLPPIPCSATTLISCTGNLLDQFGAGLGARVRQPNKNFAPQLGLAWDPTKQNKTVIRAGFGIYYDTALYNNVIFDRTDRLEKGLFLGLQNLCPGGALVLPGNPVPQTTVPSNGHVIATQICGQPIGSVASDAMELEALYKQATLTAGPQVNGGFIGNLLGDGLNATGAFQLLAPNYRTAYGLQFNIGVQHELRPGTVLSVDYLRNVGLHSLLAYDTNHVGDARYLNVTAAQNAIAATNNSFGCGNSFSTTAINCAIGAGATITDFATRGLDSGNAYLFGLSPFVLGLTPDTGAAFSGVNSNVGQNQMLFPMGRSVYNALQVKLVTQKNNPMRGVRALNLQTSYSLSRSIATAKDVDFYNNAFDFNKLGLSGPNGLDRKHQLSAGAVLEFPHGAQLGFVTHWYSALPATLYLPTPASNAGAIFTSDLTGDGSFAGNTTGQSGDILPGTGVGSFGRDLGVGGLINAINSYNSNGAGQLTPAGQALVTAGLFSQAQLIALGAVTPTIAAPPAGEVALDQFFTFDLRLSWKIKPVRRWEHVNFEPQVNIYNLFNRQNFDSPSQPLSGILNGSPGFVNGTTRGDRSNLIGLGSGVFALGAPRSLEFGFKVVF
jgi:hypothetical protein